MLTSSSSSSLTQDNTPTDERGQTRTGEKKRKVTTVEGFFETKKSATQLNF
jgi:hypothetical protein